MSKNKKKTNLDKKGYKRNYRNQEESCWAQIPNGCFKDGRRVHITDITHKTV